MKLRLLSLGLLTLIASSVCAHTYTAHVSVPLNVSHLEIDVEAIYLSCTLQGESSAEAELFVPIENRQFYGTPELEFELDKPMNHYDDLSCAMQVCRHHSDISSCLTPSAEGPSFARYDDAAPIRTSFVQSMDETLVLHTPPPSYQLAGQTGTSSSTQQTTSGKSSTSGRGTGQTPSKGFNSQLGSAAGDANTNLGYVELGLAGLAIGAAVATKDVGALGKALADFTMGGTSVATNAAFNQADSEGAIGVVGDLAGLGLGLAGAAASGAAALSGAAVLPLAGAFTGGMSLGSKINKKLDEAFDEPIQRALDAMFPNYINPVGYGDANSSSRQGQNTQPSGNTHGTGSGVAAQEAMQQVFSGAGDFRAAKKGDGDTKADTKGTGAGAGVGTGVTPGSGGSAATPGTGGAEEAAASAGSQAQGGGNQEATPINSNQTANHATGHVSSSQTNGDGSYSYVVVVVDANGNFVSGSVTECGGGTCTDTYFGADGQPTGETRTYPDNRGSAPANGAHDVWVADGDDNSSSQSSSESESDKDDEKGGGDDCQKGQEGCTTDDEPQEEEKTEETTDDKKAADSTPDPRDRDDMSEGIAWAMQNPDHPLAQQILATAAKSVEDLSGACQTGCPEAKNEGGILWAMMNPDNPLAQQILADAAEAVTDNSGSGQTGGPEDNPANDTGSFQPSDRELQQIEFLISGGGLVDPPEEGGGAPGTPPEGSPLGGGSPVVGGAPVGQRKLEVKGGSIGSGNDPDDDLDSNVQLNSSEISSGGAR